MNLNELLDAMAKETNISKREILKRSLWSFGLFLQFVDKDGAVHVKNPEADSELIKILITGESEEESTEQQPYLFGEFSISENFLYNPDYGDDRECECGDPYYRHFDTYDNMYPCGCKYCDCCEFKEKT